MLYNLSISFVALCTNCPSFAPQEPANTLFCGKREKLPVLVSPSEVNGVKVRNHPILAAFRRFRPSLSVPKICPYFATLGKICP